MNWITKQINLGDIKVGKKQTIIFSSTKQLDNIISLDSSCGCSTPSYNKEQQQLIVIYTPGSIPKHLKSVGVYTTTKTITITYEGGGSEVLSFKARVSKN